MRSLAGAIMTEPVARRLALPTTDSKDRAMAVGGDHPRNAQTQRRIQGTRFGRDADRHPVLRKAIVWRPRRRHDPSELPHRTLKS